MLEQKELRVCNIMPMQFHWRRPDVEHLNLVHDGLLVPDMEVQISN